MSVASPPTVYILLPVHNRKAITLEFIETLKKQTYSHYHLILIDDGSTDGTEDAVKALLPESSVIRGDGNLWWAGALQAGINVLKKLHIPEDSILMTINDDTLMPVDFLETGVRLITQSKKEIFCAQAFSMETGKLLDSGVKIDWFRYEFIPVKEESEISCLTTRGLFFRFSDLKTIGEFIPETLPHYYSDYEFTHRAGARGYRLRSPKELRILMNEKTTGLQTPDGLKLRAYFKKTFQIRSAINPWTGVKFVRVAAPFKYKPIAYFRLFIYFTKSVIKAAMQGF